MSDLEVLLLRFDAPLMSFGGPRVDERNATEAFPGRSLLTGLLANALGYRHREAERLARLQERLRCAARRDRRGEELVDYQTVDLGQEFLTAAWTTRGEPSRRAGGSAKTSTHIRHRHYWADAVFTVAIALDPAQEAPTVDDLARAVATPERPLFLGRKACLPAAPLLLGRTTAATLRQALEQAPLDRRAAPEDGALAAWWPEEERAPHHEARLLPVTDERDWANQVHVGRRYVWSGLLHVAEESDAG